MLSFLAVTAWKRPFLLLRHNIMECVLLGVNTVFTLLGIIYWGAKFSQAAMDALVVLVLSVSLLYVAVLFGMDLFAHLKALKRTDNDDKTSSDSDSENGDIELRNQDLN